MSIFKRVTHLIKADVHGILDSLEEPETLLKQAVREMKEQMAKREESLEQLKHRLEQSRSREKQLCQAIAESRNQVNICLDSGNDTLVRAAMRRMLELERSQKLHRTAEKNLEGEVMENEKRLRDEQERLQGITNKMQLFASTSGAGTTVSSEERLFVSEEEIDIAILQARREHVAKSSGEEAR